MEKIILPYHQGERADAENIAVFIQSCLCRRVGAKLRGLVLYEAYKSWCRDVGARACADGYLFGKEMTAYRFKRGHSNGVVYLDLELRAERLPVSDEVMRCQVWGTTVEAAQRRDWKAHNSSRINRGYRAWTFDEFRARKFDGSKNEPIVDLSKDELKVAQWTRLDKAMLAWIQASLVRVVGMRGSVAAMYSHYTASQEDRGMDHYDLPNFCVALKRHGYVVQGKGMRAALLQYDLRD